MNRKPPLPKLASVSLSPGTPPSQQPQQPAITYLYSATSGGSSPYLRQNSEHSSHDSTPEPETRRDKTSPAPDVRRPTDLPARLRTQFEDIPASPKQNRRAANANGNLVIEEMSGKIEPPPIPVRKYKIVVNNQTGIQEHNQTNREGRADLIQPYKDKDNKWQPPSPMSQPGDIQMLVTTSSPLPTPHTPHLTNVSMDSGLMVSPSPPTDSGIAVSPFIRTRQNHNKTRDDDHKSDMRQKETNSEDALSILSYSLSEGSDTSESKYDNVHLHTNNNNVKHQSEMKDGDEESDSSSIAGNLIVESSESDIGNCDCLESGALCNRTKTNSDATQPEESLMRINNRQHDHRDSGPYENVNEQQQTTNDNRNSISEYMAMGGINSLRHIITSGQTTNV